MPLVFCLDPVDKFVLVILVFGEVLRNKLDAVGYAFVRGVENPEQPVGHETAGRHDVRDEGIPDIPGPFVLNGLINDDRDVI